MPDIPIVVYATNWCPDCLRVKRFFDQHKINYTWIDIDQDSNAEMYVYLINEGMRSVPTIVCKDGSLLVEPTNAQLIHKFGQN